MTLEEFTEKSQSIAAIDAFCKAKSVLRHGEKVLVSISGGSDSDIMLDLLLRAERHPRTEFHFVWFDTGLEYQATKDHIAYLESKYGIKIERRKAEKPIPLCVIKHGVPFLSKYVSEMIERLQAHGFRFTDEPQEVLLARYPQCQSAVKWWCNANGTESDAPFNIGRFKFLKEFLIAYPPEFRISAKCCYYAKKKVAKKAQGDIQANINCYGVRKAEGGIRAKSIKTCYTSKECGEPDDFRPLFWFTDQDKRLYEGDFGVTHSRCYTQYGLKRTGCVGCPFSQNLAAELYAAEQYEPKLYNACIRIFGKSYEYTRKFRQFQKMMNEREKMEKTGIIQLELFGAE